MYYSLKKVAAIILTTGWVFAVSAPDVSGALAKGRHAADQASGFSRSFPASFANNSIKKPYRAAKKTWRGTRKVTGMASRISNLAPTNLKPGKGGKRKAFRSAKKLYFTGKVGMAESAASATIAQVGFSKPLVNSSR